VFFSKSKLSDDLLCVGVGGDADDDEITRITNKPKMFDDQLIGIVVGAVVALVLLLVGVFVFCVVCRRHRNNKYTADGKIAAAEQVSVSLVTNKNRTRCFR